MKQEVTHAAPPTATSTVVVVILCWRQYEHLPALLRSLAVQGVSCELDVTICHNEAVVPTWAGASDMPEGLAIREICTGANLGYGGGNNFAIEAVRQRAQPAYFLVLNSDVVLHPGALEAAVRWADAHPQVAVVGAVHEDPARAGRLCFGGCRYNRALSVITPNTREGGCIDYVHGAAALIRSSEFPAGPIFAEHYFLFFEELELADRVRAMGKRVGWCPGFRVTHFEGGSRRSGQADFVPEVAEYFENLNALRFTRDHCPRWLPTVLLFRGLAKPVWLGVRGKWLRLHFWALALVDLARSRVRRFPFQRGWVLQRGLDQLVDAPLPGVKGHGPLSRN